MTNCPLQKHFKTVCGDMWAFYDAQTPETKEWFQNFPIDLWPSSLSHVSDWGKNDAERKHLAGLEAVWGKDHPAVIDARTKVSTRRGKVVELLSPDDLSDLF